jgi:hypothetical protein
MTGYRHSAWLNRMFVLPMAPVLLLQTPPIALNELRDVSIFHAISPRFRGGYRSEPENLSNL